MERAASGDLLVGGSNGAGGLLWLASARLVDQQPQRKPAIESTSVDKPKREKSKVTSNGMTYADWLTRAIESTVERRLTLAEIYDWMVVNVPGLSGQRYLHSSKGWKNAVRHTLSVNARFCKIARPGRPSFWALTSSSSTSASADVPPEASKKRNLPATDSPPRSLVIDDECSSRTMASPKRLKPSITPPDESRSVISTTSITPPARTMAAGAAASSPANSSESVSSLGYYSLDYYQIPLALLAVAAASRASSHVFTPKPSSNFRTSPTSAFVSFRSRQEAKG